MSIDSAKIPTLFCLIHQVSVKFVNKNLRPVGNFKLGLLEIKIRQFQKLQNINKEISEFLNSMDFILEKC